MAENSGGTFADRTTDHYMVKHKRVDKDPLQIEYEQQSRDCTFKPTKASPKAKGERRKRANRSSSRSPANASRGAEAEKL